MPEQISENISWKEATFSITAINKGIDNTPSEDVIKNMKLVAEKIFEPCRKHFGLPIKINSFYRSEGLNKAVGGSKTSDHCKGMAIDIEITGKYNNSELFKYIKENLPFKQLIWEFGDKTTPSWVHASYDKLNLKKEVLYAVKQKGKTVYLPL